MLRFSIILTITALHLIGVDVMSARREPPQRMYSSAMEALSACQTWQQQEGQFIANIPGARLAGQPATWMTRIRSCAADLDHPTILGRRYSVVADAHYDAFLSELHHVVVRSFPYPASTEDTGLMP